MTSRDTAGRDADATPSIAALLAELNSDDTTIAEEAQYSLERLGDRAVEPVLDALPRLGVFGQRCVLDLLTDWPSERIRRASRPSVEDAVVPLLASDDAVVREWAAHALRHARSQNAIPSLRQALERAKSACADLAWTEPVALRAALTTLGDRRQVTPATLAESAQEDERLGAHWSADRLTNLLDALASENQVVLFFQAWQRRKGGFYSVETPSFAIDLQGPWPQVVARAREVAMQAAEGWIAPTDTVVTLEWIGESDR